MTSWECRGCGDHVSIGISTCPNCGVNGDVPAISRKPFLTQLEDARRIIEKQEKEIERLKAIIANALSENDELGAEYTFVLVLKAEIERLKQLLQEQTQLLHLEQLKKNPGKANS